MFKPLVLIHKSSTQPSRIDPWIIWRLKLKSNGHSCQFAKHTAGPQILQYAFKCSIFNMHVYHLLGKVHRVLPNLKLEFDISTFYFQSKRSYWKSRVGLTFFEEEKQYEKVKYKFQFDNILYSSRLYLIMCYNLRPLFDVRFMNIHIWLKDRGIINFLIQKLPKCFIFLIQK